jgi:hypothetical protein
VQKDPVRNISEMVFQDKRKQAGLPLLASIVATVRRCLSCRTVIFAFINFWFEMLSFDSLIAVLLLFGFNLTLDLLVAHEPDGSILEL